MTVIQLGQSIETKDAALQVDIDPKNPLFSGKYVFQLIVKDNDGAVSDPTFVTVVVLSNVKPTAVIDQPSPMQVPFGGSFVLTAKGSRANPPAQVELYTWTLLQAG